MCQRSKVVHLVMGWSVVAHVRCIEVHGVVQMLPKLTIRYRPMSGVE